MYSKSQNYILSDRNVTFLICIIQATEFLIDVMEGKALTKEYGVDVIKEFIGDLDNRYDIDINHRDEPYATRGAQMFKKLANGMRRVLKSHKV